MSSNKLVVLIILLSLAACTPAATATPTATLDLSTPMAQTAQAQTQLAADAQATSDAQATIDSANATGTAEVINGTATALMAQTETKATSQTRNTQTAATKQAGTQQAIASQTAQAQPMLDLLVSLQSEGYLVETAGQYFRLADHSQEQAKLNYLDVSPTFLAPSNFVIRVDIGYESASTTADWWNSSCGFLFRVNAADNDFYQAVLSLDGNVEFRRWNNGQGNTLQTKFFAKMATPNGSFELVLVVEDTWTTILIDGVMVVRWEDRSYSEGLLFYTLTSGTNKDFGTRCSFTNTDLWELEN